MFTEEQLEYIYEAVKQAQQECWIRTLVNDPISVACRELDKKRIKKYNEIIGVINKVPDNELEEI